MNVFEHLLEETEIPSMVPVEFQVKRGRIKKEETMRVPVTASMETKVIGRTPNGLDVHMEVNAWEADYVIPVGRIKPHTDFRGSIESGLMKMLCIGCGKQHGADICHAYGFPKMSENVTQAARVILEKKKVPFGIGIIEDAFHGTYKLAVIPGELIEEEETDRCAVKMALHTCLDASKAGYKVVWMKNTLALHSFYISEALAEEAAVNPLLKIIGKPEKITFDRVGNVKWLPPVHNFYGYHSPS